VLQLQQVFESSKERYNWYNYWLKTFICSGKRRRIDTPEEKLPPLSVIHKRARRLLHKSRDDCPSDLISQSSLNLPPPICVELSNSQVLPALRCIRLTM